jgi:inhibitor of KinA sporulation pathway (predicted exonuclease)
MFSILGKGIMRFLAADLELEQPKSNPQTPDSRILTEKIIQVGICVFETGEEFKLLHSETMHINYNRPLSEFIKTLTSIKQEDVESSPYTTADALKKIGYLMRIYETDRRIVEWGGGDVKALQRETGFSDDFCYELGLTTRNSFNAKILFQCYAMMNGIKAKGGLSKSVAKMGLDFRNTNYNGSNKGAHWAETDALNTAMIFNELLQRMKES